MEILLWYKSRNILERFQEYEGFPTPVSKLLVISRREGGWKNQPKKLFENNNLQRVESQRTSLT